MTSGIYQITNKLSGVVYIGSSINIERRFRGHISCLRTGKHGNQLLQNDWRKHGEKEFSFQIIEEVLSADNIIEREQSYLDRFIPFQKAVIYNICPKANSVFGVTRTEEHKEKYSKSKLGNKNPQFGNKGELSPNSKLSDLERIQIYDLYKTGEYLQKDLGKMFGISQTQAGKIINFFEDKPKVKRLSDVERDNIINDYLSRKKVTLKQLAKIHKVSIATVFRAVRRIKI